MATSPAVEQEFVAHLFAPLDGPAAELAGRQVRDLWNACQTQLGMTRPIVDAGLGTGLPADPRAEPEGALAGLQDPAVNFQAIVRREHDVLNFSLVMATPLAPPRRRLGIGSATPPGWYEFARWWRMLTATGTGALLGGAAVYQAKTRAAADADVRAALPPHDDDAAGWWTRGGVVDDFAVWEVTPGGSRAARRLVVLARPEEDARLSRFTWSAGDVALPPLGRYLMHAAKLRHQARVRGDGRELTRVRDRAAAQLDRLADLLRDPAAATQARETATELAADEAALAATLAALRQMRRSVEIARANMASALPGLLPADFALADWLAQQLVDDADYLEATREHAERMREIVGTPPAPVPPVPPLRAPTRAQPAPPRDTRVEQRLGFGVDVVDYSSRTTPQQAVVQQRLAGIVGRVLHGVGLQLHDTDRQDAGDGMMVVLPPGLELHSVLPGLLHGWRAEVVADNGTHRDDRIRLRLSVAAGPFAHSAIGFTGATIIEMGRLLDSQALRRAVVEHSDADLVALVSDRLHADVVGEGYPGLDAGQFEQLLVEVKSYRKQAWLWAGGPAAGIPSVSRAAATGSPGARAVFVIHGHDEPARRALWGFLQAIDLHPLDWEEIVARTGEPTPFVRTVLDQAFAENQAAVVLITPDDHLAPQPGPPGDAQEKVGQAAPNVLLQAGMALALQRDRTVVIEIGQSRPVSDLAGLDVIRFNGKADSLHRIAQRLRNAGCTVNTDGSDWLEMGRFAGLAG